MTDPEPADLARGFVIYGVMPVWMTAGFACRLWHCHTRIEKTSGTGNPSCTVCC
jgi:hypothetical protein